MATGRNSRRGFGSMDPEQRRRIAQRGGEASHGGRGRDYEQDYEEDYDDDDYDVSNEYEDEEDYDDDDYGNQGRSGGRQNTSGGYEEEEEDEDYDEYDEDEDDDYEEAGYED